MRTLKDVMEAAAKQSRSIKEAAAVAQGAALEAEQIASKTALAVPQLLAIYNAKRAVGAPSPRLTGPKSPHACALGAPAGPSATRALLPATHTSAFSRVCPAPQFAREKALFMLEQQCKHILHWRCVPKAEAHFAFDVMKPSPLRMVSKGGRQIHRNDAHRPLRMAHVLFCRADCGKASTHGRRTR